MPRCIVCDYCDTTQEASSYFSGVYAPGYRKKFVITEDNKEYCKQCFIIQSWEDGDYNHISGFDMDLDPWYNKLYSKDTPE